MIFTLIEHGELYTPQAVGPTSILLAGGKIAKIGPVDAKKLEALGFEQFRGAYRQEHPNDAA